MDDSEKKIVVQDDDDEKQKQPEQKQPEQKQPEQKQPEPRRAMKAKSPANDRVRIILEDSAEIPPTGLFVGLNGRGYLLQAGVEMDVPVGVVDILDHAIGKVPVIEPTTRQIVGYRERMRYPYRRVQG